MSQKRRLEHPPTQVDDIVKRVVRRTMVQMEYREPRGDYIDYRYMARPGEPCRCGYASTYKKLGALYCNNCGGVIE